MPAKTPRPSWWISLRRPCMTSGACSLAPPLTCASAWWPRHAASPGMVCAFSSASSEIRPSLARCDRRVPGVLRPAGRGGDDDVVGPQRRDLLPGQLVVADDDRLLTIDLAQQVEEVEGERVVVVDQQRFHGRAYTLPTLAPERRAPIIET